MLERSGFEHVEISIHALRKESDRRLRVPPARPAISIHALRKESDKTAEGTPCGITISIHALRKESDDRRPCVAAAYQYFNPRSP